MYAPEQILGCASPRLKMLLRAFAQVIPLLVAIGLSPLSQEYISFSFDQYFYAFHVAIFLFVCAWSCGIHPLFSYLVTFSFMAQVGLDVGKLNELGQLSHLAVPFLLFSILHILICHFKRSAEILNEIKTLWVDWIVMVVFFPLFSFSDLLLDSNVFFWLLGYFLGATFFALGMLKSAEFLWNYTFPLPNDANDTSSLIFIHKMVISQSGWNSIRFFQLIVCLYGMYWNAFTQFSSHWNEVERWQLGFLIGVGSTLWLFLGPIASKSNLSEEEFRSITDKLELELQEKSKTQ